MTDYYALKRNYARFSGKTLVGLAALISSSFLLGCETRSSPGENLYIENTPNKPVFQNPVIYKTESKQKYQENKTPTQPTNNESKLKNYKTSTSKPSEKPKTNDPSNVENLIHDLQKRGVLPQPIGILGDF